MRPVVAALLAAFFTWQSASAQYPARPIRIIVAIGAGGTADATARALAEPLSRTLGQPVIVENKPGADGAIAAETVRGSPPDGYTLLLGQGTALVGVPLTRKHPPYDPIKDFTPLSFVGRFTICLFAHPDVPAQTLADLVRHAQANPGKLSYATSSITEAIVGAQLAKSAGISMVRVPYKGPSSVLPDLLTGRLQLAFMSAASGLGHVRSGRLRALATLLPQRSPALPDVPTTIEAGFPNATLVAWFGLFGPANLPETIVERLSREINAALLLPDVRTQLERQIVEPQGSSPQALRTFLENDVATWRRAVQESGIELQ
jgi:tripartite-type tricarboxylate transporter receptor subunit TctC